MKAFRHSGLLAVILLLTVLLAACGGTTMTPTTTTTTQGTNNGNTMNNNNAGTMTGTPMANANNTNAGDMNNGGNAGDMNNQNMNGNMDAPNMNNAGAMNNGGNNAGNMNNGGNYGNNGGNMNTPTATATATNNGGNMNNNGNMAANMVINVTPSMNGNMNAFVHTGKAKINGNWVNVLITNKGFVLYYYMADKPFVSNCTAVDNCNKDWPPLLAPQGMMNVSASMHLPKYLTVHKTANGAQVCYDGHPLYTYAEDQEPLKGTGRGQDNLWYLVGFLL